MVGTKALGVQHRPFRYCWYDAGSLLRNCLPLLANIYGLKVNKRFMIKALQFMRKGVPVQALHGLWTPRREAEMLTAGGLGIPVCSDCTVLLELTSKSERQSYAKVPKGIVADIYMTIMYADDIWSSNMFFCS